MSIIDNTLAAQVPQLNPSTPLMEAAKIQAQQQETQAAQFKDRQNQVGAEMRGVAPFVNTPEFPQKWAQAADNLLRRGVIDPQTHSQIANSPSPLMLKSIISKTDDPEIAFRKDEATRLQGNADRSYGLLANADKRAGAAEGRAAAEYENTPDQYVANPKFGQPGEPKLIDQYAQAKSAAEANAPGGGGLSLNPVYGKDKDGNTVLLQMGKNGVAAASKLPEGVTLSGLSNEAVAADAQRLNTGDPNVLKKYSNKGQGRIDLLRLGEEANRQRIEKNQSPIDITQAYITTQGDTARERAAGTMEGRMAPASIEAQGAFKIASNAMDNLSRTNYVPVNKLLQMGESAMSNPELKAAKVAINTAVMTYSRAIAPTGVGTVDSQQHAREILSTADGKPATDAAFAQLAREVDMAHASPGIARQYFSAARKARLEGKPMPVMPEYQPAQPAASAPPPEAIAALKQDPKRAADFDAYYGAGSAAAVLGR